MRRILTPAFDGDAVGDEALDQQLGQLRIVLGQHARGLEHGDARAEPAMRLRHLEADRAAADDDQMLGQHAVLEDRLVGEIGHVLEAGDRRHGGRRAGGDDEAARA